MLFGDFAYILLFVVIAAVPIVGAEEGGFIVCI